MQVGARDSQVVEYGALRAAARLMNGVMERDTPAPNLVLTVHGGLQLEWHLVGIDIEVEAFPNGEVVAVYADDDLGVDLDAEGDDTAKLVKRALAEVSTRSTRL